MLYCLYFIDRKYNAKSMKVYTPTQVKRKLFDVDSFSDEGKKKKKMNAFIKIFLEHYPNYI